MQPRRRDILTIRGQRQIVAVRGYFVRRSVFATRNTIDDNCFANSPFPLHKCFVTPMAFTWTISTISEVGWNILELTSRLMIPASLRDERAGAVYARCLSKPMAPCFTLISVPGRSREARSGARLTGGLVRVTECAPTTQIRTGFSRRSMNKTHRDAKGSPKSTLRRPKGRLVCYL